MLRCLDKQPNKVGDMAPVISRQATQTKSHLLNTPLELTLPSKGTRLGLTYQRSRHPEALQTGSLHRSLEPLTHQGLNTRTKRNCKPAARGTRTAEKVRQNEAARKYVPDEGKTNTEQLSEMEIDNLPEK